MASLAFAELVLLMNRDIKWIKSGGGPLICVERERAQSWLGVSGNSVKQGADSTYATDYERACQISDYLGKVKLADQYALVLGDMPLQTLIWRTRSGLPRIVRVFYGDPGVDVTQLLDENHELDFSSPLEIVDVEFKFEQIVIFDSALPGIRAHESQLMLEFLPGNYRVLTQQFEPDTRTSVLIHKFEHVASKTRSVLRESKQA
jgi:Immunity protein 21